jgi:hypothetical protein
MGKKEGVTYLVREQVCDDLCGALKVSRIGQNVAPDNRTTRSRTAIAVAVLRHHIRKIWNV